METKEPLVSVLFPVYNAGRYLEEAIWSLLNQSYRNIEIIAVDDCSTDTSGEILARVASADKRVKIVRHTANQGLVATLNEAIGAARGELLARMDADDVAMPLRFERQVAALLERPQAALVTGSFEVIDQESIYLYTEVIPLELEDVSRRMYIRNPIAHGSVMYRKAAVIAAGMYRSDYGPTEDFDLWRRLVHVGEFIILPHVVFRWRVNPTGITSSQNTVQQQYVSQILDEIWQSPPSVLTAAQLQQKLQLIRQTAVRFSDVQARQLLEDNVLIAVKLIKRRQFKSGARQLFAVIRSRRGAWRLVYAKVRPAAVFQVKRALRFGRASKPEA